MTTRVLVDNCIFSDANMLQGAKLTTYKDREQTEVSSFIVGYIRKPPLPEKQARRQNEIDWFPTIAQLSEYEHIKLFTYDELNFESWFRSEDSKIGNVFSESSVTFVEPAISRSHFRQGDMLEQIRSENKVDFFESLLKWTPDLFQSTEFESYLPKLTLDSIKNIDRFKKIAEALTAEQLQDAFHLWTAEVNDIPYFLTIDFKFINAIRNKAKSKKKPFDMVCEPITPQELSKKLGIKTPYAYKYSHDEFIGYGGGTFKIEDYGKPRSKENGLHRLFKWVRQRVFTTKL